MTCGQNTSPSPFTLRTPSTHTPAQHREPMRMRQEVSKSKQTGGNVTSLTQTVRTAGRITNTQTDRQTNRQEHKNTDKVVDLQTGSQTHRQTG